MPATLDLVPATVDPMPATVDLMPARVDLMPATLDLVPATVDPMPATVDVMAATVDLMPATAAVSSTIRVKSSRKRSDSSSVYNCLLCYKHFSNKYCLQTHAKKCVGNVENAPVPDNIGYEIMSFVWKCSHCNKYFSDKRCLQRHMKKCTGNVEKAPVGVDIEYEMSSVWKCLHCNRRFSDRQRLQKHSKKVHGTVDLMLATAIESSTIRVKQSRKKADPSSEWKCLHCNKYFITKGCLRNHNKKIHSTVDLMPATEAVGVSSTIRVIPHRITPDSSSVWKCLQCNKPFSDKYCLEKHNKKCIGNVENAPVNEVSKISVKTVRRYSCSTCQRSFANKHYLVYHIKSYHPSINVDAFGPPRIHKVLKCPGELLHWLKYR